MLIIGLILRRVVRTWHFGPHCTTFGTIMRPRVRNVSFPAGFDMSEAATKLGNILAWRAAFCLALIAWVG